eukprot:TRINITY_DN24556_c0_g1_i1.p1 TRINITY_DN24556_c0_g1~~TRINITY_DN24556_c0_g1_i1.p1  ORF type:complete len:386 (+),score=77.29 TRINITY_DN24556_c0_g1_i1:661-1818(+)
MTVLCEIPFLDPLVIHFVLHPPSRLSFTCLLHASGEMDTATPTTVPEVIEAAACLSDGEVCRDRVVLLSRVNVLRRKELSRGLYLVTVSGDGGMVTVVVKQEELGGSVKEAVKGVGVGAEITVKGFVERSLRGVPGVLCVEPPEVTEGKASSLKSTGQGHLTTTTRSECRLGVSCPKQDVCPYTHTRPPAPVDPHLGSKKVRFHVVGDFILAKMAMRELESGPLLDVAGGKGYLSLHVAESSGNRVRCVVIDPVNNGRGSAHREKVKNAGIERITLTTTSPHLPTPLLQAASCIAGVHPDEATDDIVTLALDHNKAFFVVPCCVFPTKFPHRKLPTGEPVTTTSDLIQYLASLCAARGRTAATATLPFQGANKVLYSLPSPPEPL